MEKGTRHHIPRGTGGWAKQEHASRGTGNWTKTEACKPGTRHNPRGTVLYTIFEEEYSMRNIKKRNPGSRKNRTAKTTATIKKHKPFRPISVTIKIAENFSALKVLCTRPTMYVYHFSPYESRISYDVLTAK